MEMVDAFPRDRRTIIVLKGLLTAKVDYKLSVVTEFHADLNNDANECSHTTTYHHYSHPKNYEELDIAGQRV